MTPFFIGISGGSGSGKTVLARELKKHFGRKAKMLNMDKYQRFGEKLPQLFGMENWDCPAAIKWDKLYKDLISLKKNKGIIIAEGYFLFYKPKVRRLFDFRVFLTASEKTRVERRKNLKNEKYIKKILLPKYIKKIVLPMHKKYIEPTKKFANLVLNTEKYSVKQCCQKVLKYLALPRF